MIKLLKKLKPFWLLIVGVIVFVLLQSIADLFVPSLLARVTEAAGLSGDISGMIVNGLIALSAVLATIVANIIGGFFASKVSSKFGQKLRSEVFAKVETFGVKEFENFGASSLITRTTNDITQIQQTVFMILRIMVSAPIMMIGGIVMTARLNISLTFVVLSTIPVFLLSFLILTKKVIPLFKQNQVNLDKLNLVTRESITGIRIVRAFGNEKNDEKKFEEINSSFASVATKANQTMAFAFPIVDLVFSITILLIIWVGMKTILTVSDAANVISVMQYAMRIMFSFMMMMMMFIMIPRSSICAKRVNEVLGKNTSISNPANPISAGESKPGELEFKNVCFKFDDASKNAVENISFTVKKGEVFAIIGGTGSGKSTIANLIPRFYDATGGEILFEGVNIKNLDIEQLRSKIAIIPQIPAIFNRTVADNVLYGATDKSKENLSNAIKLSQSEEFVKKLDGETSFKISQNGKNLSGGQKQRIAIARAIAKRPAVYVFDDCFSALDNKTDALVQKGLKSVFESATTIIVSQRVTSITKANQIMVLDDGAIVGIGTFKELEKTCPAFQEIVLSQAKKGEN